MVNISSTAQMIIIPASCILQHQVSTYALESNRLI
jgi:hypothetical protein